MRKPRLMVIGNARHGKDSVCAILRDEHGLTFESSSHFVAEKAVRPYLAARGVHYTTLAAMYGDRVNHRAAWFKAIDEYNTPDRTRLGRELFEVFDMYCGIRNRPELEALKAAGVVEFTIWVDASRRLPPESGSSISVTADQADHILDNNGPLEDLPAKVAEAYRAALQAIGYEPECTFCDDDCPYDEGCPNGD